MKKIVSIILFTAMLVSFCIPFSVSAAIPSDYSENLVSYWDFEGDNKYVDVGTASTTSNNLVTGGTGTGIKIVDGVAQFPPSAATYFQTNNMTDVNDMKQSQALTIGFKVKLHKEGSGTGNTILFTRTNAFQVRATHDNTSGGYKLQWLNDGLTQTVCIVDIFGTTTFDYESEYYFFIVVEADTKTEGEVTVPVNHVTGYYSTDGKSFISNENTNTEHYYIASINRRVCENGYVFGSYSNKSVMTVGNTHGSSAARARLYFDDIWYFNTAVAASSLPVIALHGENIYGVSEPVEGAPNYRGCQVSAVANGEFSTRFVATIDSLDYKEVGFEITVIDYKGDVGVKTVYDTHYVFKEIIGTDDIGKKLTYTAEELGGEYIYALAVNEIPTDAAVTFLITPYHVEMGETEHVPGVSYTVTVNNGKVISQTEYSAQANS